MEYEQVNIGIDDNPKMINIGKCCSHEEKCKFVALLHKYIDVLAYSYDDLKSFQSKELYHDISLKSGFAPFCQKKR